MIRASITASAAAILFLASAGASSALTIPVLPNNMCALDPRVPAEKTMYDYMQSATATSGNLVKVFADCNELKALTTGKMTEIHHYGTILRQTALGKITIPRAQFLSAAGAIYQKNNKALDQAVAATQAQTTIATKNGAMPAATHINATSNGVLYEDNQTVIMGLQQSHEINNKNVEVMSTVGLTLLEGSPVSVNLYAPANESGAQAAAVKSLKGYMPKLIVANPG